MRRKGKYYNELSFFSPEGIDMRNIFTTLFMLYNILHSQRNNIVMRLTSKNDSRMLLYHKLFLILKFFLSFHNEKNEILLKDKMRHFLCDDG